MPDMTKHDLAKYRIEKAWEFMQSADSAFERDDYPTVANRSYYSILHAMRAALALERYDSKKHSGVISEFRKCYILTGIFPIEFSDMIGQAFFLRTQSDYDEFYLVSKEEVVRQLDNAGTMLAAIDAFISKQTTP